MILYMRSKLLNISPSNFGLYFHDDIKHKHKKIVYDLLFFHQLWILFHLQIFNFHVTIWFTKYECQFIDIFQTIQLYNMYVWFIHVRDMYWRIILPFSLSLVVILPTVARSQYLPFIRYISFFRNGILFSKIS